MPTYDYRCNACGHEFELFQSMSESPKRKCPACDKLRLERLIGTGAAVIFKGSGFYQTDYRSESYKKAAEKEKPSDSKSDKPDKSSKSDSKPAKAASEGKSGGAKTTESKAGCKTPKSD